jgi:hypothetical protein
MGILKQEPSILVSQVSKKTNRKETTQNTVRTGLLSMCLCMTIDLFWLKSLTLLVRAENIFSSLLDKDWAAVLLLSGVRLCGASSALVIAAASLSYCWQSLMGQLAHQFTLHHISIMKFSLLPRYILESLEMQL